LKILSASLRPYRLARFRVRRVAASAAPSEQKANTCFDQDAAVSSGARP
jgi:hypothetical protein